MSKIAIKMNTLPKIIWGVKSSPNNIMPDRAPNTDSRLSKMEA